MILPTRQQTTYCTLTDRKTERHTDGHEYTEQIQRDRKRKRVEGERQRTRSRFLSIMPADKLPFTLGRMAVESYKKRNSIANQSFVNKDVISKP